MTQKQEPIAPLIEIKDLSAGYNHEIVLNDINFSISQNDFIGLIGPNGGGKTTLLKVILGLVEPQRGTVRIKGEIPQLGRRNIGYVPQIAEYDTDFPISVQDIVRMGRLSPKRLFKPYTAEDDDIVRERLGWLDMLKFKDQALRELSGGQRQRVYIARALVTDPELLLLDEPTISVDFEARTQIFDLLYEINQRGIAILLVSHDLTAISSYVKTIGCLNRKLYYEGKKEITVEMLEASYSCPVDLIAHGLPHRVVAEHPEEPS
jgi:zinc transport system ATP-binding protein